MRVARELGCEIVFAVDPDRRRWVPAEGEDCQFTDKIDTVDAARSRDCDAIFVAVPHDIASDTCLWALDRGAHVLCEKPLGISAAQADEVRVTARRAGRLLSTGFNHRYLAGIGCLRELLKSQALGEIQRVRMFMGHGGRPGMETEWKLQRKRAGGGAIIDPGIHLIDLARHLFGEPKIKAASMRRLFWDVDVEDNCMLDMTCGGAYTSIEVSLTAWKNIFSIDVAGRNGVAMLSGRGGNYGPQRLEFVNRWFWNGDNRRFVRDLGGEDRSFETETAAFLAKLTTGSDDGILSMADDGYAALNLVEGFYEIAKESEV